MEYLQIISIPKIFINAVMLSLFSLIRLYFTDFYPLIKAEVCYGINTFKDSSRHIHQAFVFIHWTEKLRHFTQT